MPELLCVCLLTLLLEALGNDFEGTGGLGLSQTPSSLAMVHLLLQKPVTFGIYVVKAIFLIDR